MGPERTVGQGEPPNPKNARPPTPPKKDKNWEKSGGETGRPHLIGKAQAAFQNHSSKDQRKTRSSGAMLVA